MATNARTEVCRKRLERFLGVAKRPPVVRMKIHQIPARARKRAPILGNPRPPTDIAPSGFPASSSAFGGAGRAVASAGPQSGIFSFHGIDGAVDGLSAIMESVYQSSSRGAFVGRGRRR
jgi:hypothetical protein